MEASATEQQQTPSVADIFEPEPVSVLRRRRVGSRETPSESDVVPGSDTELSSDSELSTGQAEESDTDTPTDNESETVDSDDTDNSGLLEAGAVGIQGPEDFLNFHFRIGGGIVSVCHTLIMFVALIVYMWIIAYQFEQMKKCQCD
jgi:hypothetical protein